MSLDDLPALPETRNVDPAHFKAEILPAGRPVVLRGAVDAWSIVGEAPKGAEAIGDYLRRFDNGRHISAILAPPETEGRLFYSDDFDDVNFQRARGPFAVALKQILASRSEDVPTTTFVESTPVSHVFPELHRHLPMPLAPPEVEPRIWIGNRTTVHTHYDLNDNIACVVAGRRRFTLFPPDQIGNLYIGPMDRTPSGAPLSIAPVESPDFERFPRFREAMAHAQTAVLHPGDAIYIPYFWWHHVKALDAFNVLINYWWRQESPTYGSPRLALWHAILSIRDLPPAYRAAWRDAFDHLVFSGEAGHAHHLPESARGVLGELTPEKATGVRKLLSEDLKSD